MGGNYSIFKSDNEVNQDGILELFNNMDRIAADYITSESFTDMHNLLDDKYCSKLVILTTDILSSKLKPYEISYLDKRIRMGSDEVNKLVKEDIAFFNKNTIDELDVKDGVKKQGMCKGIAKFYIKLAHIYGAIITAMNPVYEYKDTDGNLQQITLDNRNKLSDDIISKVSKISNFCNQRIIALSSKIIEKKEEKFKKIKPEICSLNKKDVPDESGNTKTLIEASGFKELERLYMDDYIDGKFKMSDSSKKRYDKDVKSLDKAINGSNADATNFSNIKLNPFHNTDECKLPDGLPEAQIDDTSSAFKEYGELIRKMIKTSEETQISLLGELKQMFSFEKENGEIKATLRENLNQYRLDKISKRCRDIIINMYIDCEEDFIKGLEIYQAIVEDLKYDILSKDDGLPNEKSFEIQNFVKDINKLSLSDNDSNQNYSQMMIDDIKNLIGDGDNNFNSLFEGGLKYDDQALKGIKDEVRKLINEDKENQKDNNKSNIEDKINMLKKLMYEKDNEKSKPLNKDVDKSDDSLREEEAYSDASQVPNSEENKKNDIDALLKYLKDIEKILPLLDKITNTTL